MFVRSRKQIIAFVNRCLLGQTGKDVQLELGDYDVDETFFFWTMFGIGSAQITGTISKETARQEQNRVGGLFRGMAVQIFHWRNFRSKYTDLFKKYSLAVSRADRYLKSRDAEQFMFALMDAFCAVVGENVHAELFREAAQNEDFMRKCIDTLLQNEDYFTEKFGDAIRHETYLPLLEKFYAACKDDGTAELFNGFGDEADAYLDVEKQDDLRQFGQNTKVLYGITQNR